MTDDVRRDDSSTELVDVIRQVRRRWRMKLALRGALGVLGLGLIVLLLSAYGLESWRFTPSSIITFRIILGLALAGLVAYLLVRPLMRNATDEQVALYLEEHEPSLQAAIISAVEAGRGQGELALLGVTRTAAGASRRSRSAARSRAAGVSSGGACGATAPRWRRLRSRRSRCSCSALPICATRCRRCSIVSRDVEAAAPYRIEVTPGNATVPQGADQTITAQLSGFDADQASLMVQQDARRRVRARAAAAQGDERQVRRHAVRSRPARSSTSSRQRRQFEALQAEGRRAAVRAAARARISLPGLHRSAAAEGRRRRRHRRAQGHRGARARRPDDGARRAARSSSADKDEVGPVS